MPPPLFLLRGGKLPTFPTPHSDYSFFSGYSAPSTHRVEPKGSPTLVKSEPPSPKVCQRWRPKGVEVGFKGQGRVALRCPLPRPV